MRPGPARAISAGRSRAEPVAAQGHLDRVGPDGVVEGWCWIPGRPESPAKVAISVDGQIALTAACTQHRADLRDSGIGDGAHAFAATLPSACRSPGRTSAVRLHALPGGEPIGEAIVVTWADRSDLSATPLIPVGNLDGVTRDGRVTGWCWYPSDPDAHLNLEVLVGDTPVATSRAVLYRSDLQQAGIGDGTHGFSFALPFAALEGRGRVTVAVRDKATGRHIGTPATLRLGPLSATEDRVTEMERQIRALRARITELTAALDSREAPVPAQQIYGALGTLFAELASAVDPNPALAHGAMEVSMGAALAHLQSRHRPIRLAVPARLAATLAVPSGHDMSALYRCIAGLHAAGIDQHAAIVVLADRDSPADIAFLPALIGNLDLRRLDEAYDLAASVMDLARRDPACPLAWLSPLLHPEPGWLETLQATLLREPEVALVTGRVLGQDGLLRHAGLQTDAHGLLAPQGFMDDPDKPDLRHLRDVDAVLPLSFILRSEALQACGGLGAGLAASEAILDLCIRLRQHGHRIMLQPNASSVCIEAADLDQLLSGAPVAAPVSAPSRRGVTGPPSTDSSSPPAALGLPETAAGARLKRQA